MKLRTLICKHTRLLPSRFLTVHRCGVAWVTVLVFLALPGYAQEKAASDTSTCRHMIEAYMQAMEKDAYPSGNQRYHMRMKVTTIARAGTAAANAALSSRDIEVQVNVGKGRLAYESTYLSVYQDSSHMFTVIHPRKTILWSKPDPAVKQGRAVLAQNLSAGQRKVLAASSVQQCRDTLYAGVWTKVIELTPNAKARQEFKIRRAVYYYTPSQHMLRKQVVEFTDQSPVARQIIVYTALDTHYRGKAPQPAVHYVFSRSNGASLRHSTLTERYRNYRVERE